MKKGKSGKKLEETGRNGETEEKTRQKVKLMIFGENPASRIFHPLLSFDYFNPAILLIKKLPFGRFKVWFGTKAAKIGDFGHLNFTFGK